LLLGVLFAAEVEGGAFHEVCTCVALPPNRLYVCIGNKADLEGQRAVTAEEAQAYANENGLHFVETSAKTAANVNELFFEIARKLPKAEASAMRPQGGIVLSQNAGQQPQERKGACC
jgi:Ras-related protein Rab-5C